MGRGKEVHLGKEFSIPTPGGPGQGRPRSLRTRRGRLAWRVVRRLSRRACHRIQPRISHVIALPATPWGLDMLLRAAFPGQVDRSLSRPWLCALGHRAGIHPGQPQHRQVGNAALAREEVARWLARFHPGMDERLARMMVHELICDLGQHGCWLPACEMSTPPAVHTGDPVELADVRWISLAEADEAATGMYEPVRDSPRFGPPGRWRRA